ncbi:alpha-glucuronidase family glycosyl hydrolase [Clostridium oryzae]|uniref:Xylan alpha-1,2-glucuronidase n=1 Tax=Clostridium oryzae TaxID=1450648 RepID=A0A1V4IH76_9CLOT|nr:alpha-glucuronidase family glycosyl hydrolase [Clostridium oryzae]OPJ59276.1 xylan alpha-(1->2)-glucuronosidase [Clostridium oryzae]
MLEKQLIESNNGVYNCWLNYAKCLNPKLVDQYKKICSCLVVNNNNTVKHTAVEELKLALKMIIGIEPLVSNEIPNSSYLFVGTLEDARAFQLETKITEKYADGSYEVKAADNEQNTALQIIGKDGTGVLYGIFYLIRNLRIGKEISQSQIVDIPRNKLRMINHWDNASGDIERGYAGQSFFYSNDEIIKNFSRIKDYARLLGSIGINGVVINNVNVHNIETKFITKEYLPDIARFADVFRNYGIKLYLSINYASPIELGGLKTADPLDEAVKQWWKKTADLIYDYIPDFGGFLVKADSEGRPGPFTYERNHAQGANVLAEALKPHGGIVIWRCFVYNCHLDWRDRSLDRAKAAYDNFKPLDGEFMDNVILQVKNGPMDFQIREAVSPLFGAMEKTNMILEFQAAQEYTGQQKHVCYLLPMWKEVLNFDTHAKGEGSYVSKVVDGSLFNSRYSGIVAVSNLGDSKCWTGHPLAQANLYGIGRIAWNPELSSEEIAKEWVKLTYGCDEGIVQTVVSILMESREVYEKYTSPLGIGWMVNPNYHYGPSVEGYEYSRWGTYHYADWKGIGVDRTVSTGTGYTAQYHEAVASMYENIETCPEALLLFFHHVPYKYQLKTGKTLIQHIYDTHFEGVEKVEEFIEKWMSLKGKINEEAFGLVCDRLRIQLKDSKEWRDQVNTYFYRRTGIKDIKGRKIYE